MRIGCHVSALQNERKAPYDEAIENAGRLGFDGVELIAMDRGELTEYYTPDRVRGLRAAAASNKVAISQFAIYSTACDGMASLDPAEKSRDIALFRHGIDICRELGCGIINIVSHWPLGVKAPLEYIPAYYYPIARGLGRAPSPKFKMTLPPDFDFAAIWRNYIDSLRIVSEAAADRGVKVSVEGHAHVIVSGVDAMLRMFDQVGNPALTINFDAAWHLALREYVPMSILKLRGHISHVHVRDGDGLLFYTAPPGQGIIDWEGVFTALREIGYNGFLSFEWGGYDDYLDVARDAKDYVSGILRKLGIK